MYSGIGNRTLLRPRRAHERRLPVPRRPGHGRLRNHLWVTLLAVKLLLAPGFVVCASLAARRFGPRVGGLIAGLPLVAGPILLIYALNHGRAFAAGAAAGTLLGLISLTAYIVVYGRLARRLSWAPTMLLGWLAFAVMTVIFSAVSLPVGVALALALRRLDTASAFILGTAVSLLAQVAILSLTRGEPTAAPLPAES
jgi:hypothetical protein